MKRTEKAPDWKETGLMLEGVKLFTNLDYRSLINKANEKYLPWDKIKYQKVPEGTTSSAVWAAVKFSRSIQAKQVRIGVHRFSFNLTDYIQKALHEFDLNIGGQMAANSLLPEDDKKAYLVSSIMEEAIASSQIEGAVTTRRQAKEMLRRSSKPRNKSEQMIVNNYRTIKHIVEIKNERLTEEKLFEIHRLIVNDTMDDPEDEGRYRDNDEVNVVDVLDGEVVYTPPSCQDVPLLMEALFTFFNDEEEEELFIHPIIKGCIIHFLIGYIHPFADGNGRTARALFYWYLLRKGYWLTEYLSISRLIVRSKVQYAQAYIHTEEDDNDLTYFLHYKVKTMLLAYSSLREYIQRKISEKKQVVQFHRLLGVNDRQALLVKWMYEEPDLMLNVKEVQTRFNVSNETARNDLAELVQAGYLDIIHLNKKTKGYCRSKDFARLIEVQFAKSKKKAPKVRFRVSGSDYV